LAQERLHAELAEERLRRVQEVSDLRLQFAEKQASRQTDIADSPVNVTAPDCTEIQGAQKISTGGGGGSMDYSTPIKSDRGHSLLFSRFIHLCQNSWCRNN